MPTAKPLRERVPRPDRAKLDPEAEYGTCGVCGQPIKAGQVVQRRVPQGDGGGYSAEHLACYRKHASPRVQLPKPRG